MNDNEKLWKTMQLAIRKIEQLEAKVSQLQAELWSIKVNCQIWESIRAEPRPHREPPN